jgi:hypothetical protein
VNPLEDVMKINGSEATVEKAAARITKAELLDIAAMLGLFVGFVSIISVMYGNFSLLP